MITTNQIRDLYIEYFVKQGHHALPSASLVPYNDPSLLFVNAGMVPFKDFFTGKILPTHTSLVTCQKSLRAGGKHNDLNNVGFTNRHHTFFEMLGNFSFGAYFKEAAISYAWDFLTNILCMDPSRLSVTVYHDDSEAKALWKKIAGLTDNQIQSISSDDNFWSMGEVGPCGPCSEIFYQMSESNVASSSDHKLEIWNLVFMQFEKMATGELVPLSQPCIDTGMGLERIAAVLQGQSDNYKNDVFQFIMQNCSQYTDCVLTADNLSCFKVVADHTRAVCFAISDGVLPSNVGREYVIRHIIRRGMYYAKKLSHKPYIMSHLVSTIVEVMSEFYPELLQHKLLITKTLEQEEDSFNLVLDRGYKLLLEKIQNLPQGAKVFPEEQAFRLYDTFGFPVETTIDILQDYQLTLSLDDFQKCLKRHQQHSYCCKLPTSSAQKGLLGTSLTTLTETNFIGYTDLSSMATVLAVSSDYLVVNQSPFYPEQGGQVGDIGWVYSEKGQVLAKVINTTKVTNVSGKSVILHCLAPMEEDTDLCIIPGMSVLLKVDLLNHYQISSNHTATHLLNQALKKILGNCTIQHGSYVSAMKLRFDFNCTEFPSSACTQLEQDINAKIQANCPVKTYLLSKSEAIDSGVVFLHGENYPEMVRVVDINQYRELCAGTHVESTGMIGLFKIVKISTVSSGIKRIEAITNKAALDYFVGIEKQLYDISELCNVKTSNLQNKVKELIHVQDSYFKLQKQYLLEHNYYIESLGGQVTFQVKFVDNLGFNKLSSLVNKLDNTVALFVLNNSDYALIGLIVKDLDQVNAANMLMDMMYQFFPEYNSGGNACFAQGKVPRINPDLLDNVIASFREILGNLLLNSVK